MEFISDCSEVSISGSLQMNITPSQICMEANEDVSAASETVVDDPEHVVLEKTYIVQKKIVLKEKLIIPKSNTSCLNPDSVLSDGQTEPQATYTEIHNGIEILAEEMDFSSQASLESKMEFGSQESGELRMEICSQESITSKMELCSQENILTDLSLDSDSTGVTLAPSEAAKQDIGNKSPMSNDDLLDEDDIRRKKRVKHDEDSLDNLQNAREASLLIREKAVTEREAAVLSREKLIQNLENSVLNHIEQSKSKQRKRVKFSY